MAIYLKYQATSGPIKGPVTTEGFKDWIELESVSFGSGRALGTARAGSASRQANEPSLSEVTCSKSWDWQSSAKLFEESVKGKLDNKVEIHFTAASSGNKAPVAQLIIKLEKVGLASFSTSAAGGNSGVPSESFSLNFAKIELIPKKIDNDTAVADGPKVNYDLESGKANA